MLKKADGSLMLTPFYHSLITKADDESGAEGVRRFLVNTFNSRVDFKKDNITDDCAQRLTNQISKTMNLQSKYSRDYEAMLKDMAPILTDIQKHEKLGKCMFDMMMEMHTCYKKGCVLPWYKGDEKEVHEKIAAFLAAFEQIAYTHANQLMGRDMIPVSDVDIENVKYLMKTRELSPTEETFLKAFISLANVPKSESYYEHVDRLKSDLLIFNVISVSMQILIYAIFMMAIFSPIRTGILLNYVGKRILNIYYTAFKSVAKVTKAGVTMPLAIIKKLMKFVDYMGQKKLPDEIERAIDVLIKAGADIQVKIPTSKTKTGVSLKKKPIVVISKTRRG